MKEHELAKKIAEEIFQWVNCEFDTLVSDIEHVLIEEAQTY